MSLKEIRDAMEKGSVLFGIRQSIKNAKKLSGVFIAKDARDETVERLESANIEFVVLKPKAELSKELNLDFESEVFSLTHQGVPTKRAK